MTQATVTTPNHLENLKSQYEAPAKDAEGLTDRERFLRRKLALGLFLPSMSGGGGGHYPTELGLYAPTWQYNLACSQRVDELGWDFIFPVGRWRGSGGRTHFQEFSLDVISLTAGLAARTKHCMVFTTWHVTYGMHPMHVAKIGAGIDHVSGGRWGLNVVTGWKPSEVGMFGLPFVDKESRYRMADELLTMVEVLWEADDFVQLDGEFFHGTDCLVYPKPLQDPKPLVVSAGQSAVGLEFAAKHADVVFIQGGSGDRSEDVSAVAEVVQTVRAAAAAQGKDRLKVLLPVVLGARDTAEEAEAFRAEIIRLGDFDAARNVLGDLVSGSESFSEQTLEPVILGVGGFKLFGTPERVADVFEQLSEAGVDGIQLILFDYLNDIEYFASRIQPLLEARGLRDVV